MRHSILIWLFVNWFWVYGSVFMLLFWFSIYDARPDLFCYSLFFFCRFYCLLDDILIWPIVPYVFRNLSHIIVKGLGRICSTGSQNDRELLKSRLWSVLGLVGTEIAFQVLNVNVFPSPTSPVYDVELDSAAAVGSILGTFTRYTRRHESVARPQGLDGVSLYNAVTPGTRIRLSLLRVSVFHFLLRSLSELWVFLVWLLWWFCCLWLCFCVISNFSVLFQSFGIGYKRLYPDGQVRVHSNDPRPIIRVKPDSSSNFRRYNFVDAVLTLDPVGKLGLMASDYKVSALVYYFSLCFSVFPLLFVDTLISL